MTTATRRSRAANHAKKEGAPMPQQETVANGTHYVPPQGRPPRKAKDPVRTGFKALRHTLSEAMSQWEQNVTLAADRSHYEIANDRVPEYVKNALVVAQEKLTMIVSDIERMQGTLTD